MTAFDETTYQINQEVMVTAGLQDRINQANTKTKSPTHGVAKMILHDVSGKHLIVTEDVISLSHRANEPILVRFRVTPGKLIQSQKALRKEGLLLTYGVISVDNLCCMGWACESINKDMAIVEIQLFKGTPDGAQILKG